MKPSRRTVIAAALCAGVSIAPRFPMARPQRGDAAVPGFAAAVRQGASSAIGVYGLGRRMLLPDEEIPVGLASGVRALDDDALSRARVGAGFSSVSPASR